MSSTLILGREEDPCCRLVRDRLAASGRDVILLAEDRLFPGLDLSWEMAGGKSHGLLGGGKQIISFSEIDAVLARCSGIATSAEDFATTDGQYLSSEWHGLLRGFLEALTCPVINRPRPELWYKTRLSVPELISLAPGVKFRLPATMITTRIEDARAFFRACGNSIRYSPLTMPSNYPIETDEHLGKLESLLKFMPLFLSEVIPGDAVDAFVVGTRVVFDPPVGGAPAVADLCLDIGRQLGLAFFSLQLIKTAPGEWYCFGVDCMPYLIQCADDVRHVVAAHLADALVSGDGRTI